LPYEFWIKHSTTNRKLVDSKMLSFSYNAKKDIIQMFLGYECESFEALAKAPGHPLSSEITRVTDFLS
jgi:hypothetical protein